MIPRDTPPGTELRGTDGLRRAVREVESVAGRLSSTGIAALSSRILDLVGEVQP